MLCDREVRFSIFCYGSEFNGILSSNKPFENLIEVGTTISLILRSILDRLSFMNACGYDFDLIGVALSDHQTHQIFGVAEPIFFDNVEQQQKFTREKIPFIDDFLNLSFHDVRLDHAIRCFSHAMRDKALTTLFCYLAIETLARRISEIVEKREIENIDKKIWEAFRSALNLNESTIKSDIKILADKFRHGNFINTSWAERKKTLSLTWEVIRRAMHFIKTGTQLSKTEFPEL